MEKRAFDKVRQGHLEEARAVLFSDEYERQKQAYATGMTVLARELQDSADTLLDIEKTEIVARGFTICATIFVLALGWILLFRTIRKWQMDLLESNRRLSDRTRELAELSEQLDRRVVERTKELEDSRKQALQVKEEAETARQSLERANRVLQSEMAERERTEEDLRRSETFLDSVVENIPDMIFVKNAWDLTFYRVNKACEELIGRSRKELIGKSDYDFFPKEEADFFVAKDREVLAGGGPADIAEEKLHTRSGDERILHTKKITIRKEDGTPQYLLGISEDVTERRRAQEEVRRKNRELETLLYVTSHDLREPLRGVQSFCRLVRDRYSGRMDEKGRDFLDRIVKATERLDRLLEDVLALSRAQRMEPPSEEVDAKEIVQETLERLEASVQASGAQVRVAEDLPRLTVNRMWATQAVYNLISNALKFTRPGVPPEVEIGPYQPESGKTDEVGIVVRDRGLGVDPEHSERIFDLFQRAVGREIEGTGAGLAIVRQVAERHGGRAWVQPRPGSGSEFFLTFKRPPRTPDTAF
jgi:PAS domain S-box-containing protein